MYDTCDMETKKMILSQIFNAVQVRRDYEVEIDLTATCEQLGIVLGEFSSDEAVTSGSRLA